jgi:endonuclease III
LRLGLCISTTYTYRMQWNISSRQARAQLVAHELAAAFPSPDIPLQHRNSFELLVAVILSAQCTDARVNQITPLLFAKAPTPEAMAALPQSAIYQIIKPCGLGPAKSKNLKLMASQLVKEHGGQVPDSREELQALPGVGRKTASVILAQAFGQPAMPVDTHILRSAQRWGLSRQKTPEGVEADICLLYPPETWNALHLQIIYYARAYCGARSCKGPKGEPHCPLCQKLADSTIPATKRTPRAKA